MKEMFLNPTTAGALAVTAIAARDLLPEVPEALAYLRANSRLPHADTLFNFDTRALPTFAAAHETPVYAAPPSMQSQWTGEVSPNRRQPREQNFSRRSHTPEPNGHIPTRGRMRSTRSGR